MSTNTESSNVYCMHARTHRVFYEVQKNKARYEGGEGGCTPRFGSSRYLDCKRDSGTGFLFLHGLLAPFHSTSRQSVLSRSCLRPRSSGHVSPGPFYPRGPAASIQPPLSRVVFQDAAAGFNENFNYPILQGLMPLSLSLFHARSPSRVKHSWTAWPITLAQATLKTHAVSLSVTPVSIRGSAITRVHTRINCTWINHRACVRV